MAVTKNRNPGTLPGVSPHRVAKRSEFIVHAEENILNIARIIADACRQGDFTIAGLDIMEFNMHFLGIETPDGTRDTTLSLVEKFIAALT